MPHFYNHSDTKEFGKITVTPKQWYRRFSRLGSFSFWPYMTMGKIKFILEVEKLPEREGSNRRARNVYLKLGDGSYRSILTITRNKTDIEGIAEYTGDTKFFIAPASYADKIGQQYIAKEGILLFDDSILSKNQYIFGIGGIFLTAFFSALCVLLGWLLGFIELIPAWKVWLER